MFVYLRAPQLLKPYRGGPAIDAIEYSLSLARSGSLDRDCEQPCLIGKWHLIVLFTSNSVEEHVIRIKVRIKEREKGGHSCPN